MGEVIRLLKSKINSRGELHLDAETTVIVLQFLGVASKAIEDYESLLNKFKTERGG